MPRVKRGNVRRAKRKKLLARTKGFYANKSKLYRAAKESVDTALKYAFVGRRRKKRDFRRLWVVRINAAAREQGLTYGQFMSGLKAAGVVLNAGAYTHTSIAIHDALKATTMPVVEVHLSNPFARESFRHHSYISSVAQGVICGFGAQGYVFAIDALADVLANAND